MSRTPEIDKKYISPYDQLLRDFDAKHAPSPSQQREISKHENIMKQRDHANTTAEPKEKLWDNF